MRKEMQTFMEPATDKYSMRRAVYTKNFILRYFSATGNKCLDVGNQNMVGDYIASELGLNIFNTSGDLDYNYSAPAIKYDIVICLETMEHLMSPKFFLMELKKYLHKDSQIFFTYPSRPKFLWTERHFHEYDRKRFAYLLEACGYHIISWDRKFFPSSLKGRFAGIRPFLRQFVNHDNLVYAKL